MQDFIFLFIYNGVFSDIPKGFEERIWVKYESLHHFVDELMLLFHIYHSIYKYFLKFRFFLL